MEKRFFHIAVLSPYLLVYRGFAEVEFDLSEKQKVDVLFVPTLTPDTPN